jgi:endonuclease/exonuclease/phosphatase family metal-dependent hydrolase
MTDSTSAGTAALHLATLNLWNWEFEREQRTEAAARWINDSAVDVLCVQEACVDGDWDTLARLCALTGLQVVTPYEDIEGPVNVAVISRLSAGNSSIVDLRVGPVTKETRCAVVADIDVAGVVLPVCSAHLAWGGTRESVRLRQARHLVEMFDTRFGGPDSDDPAIIAGDFNTPSTSETVRYLSGLTDHQPGTFWTDAWDARTPDQLDGTTSAGSNRYVETMASLFRPGANGTLRHGMMPDRRIDFILSRGWRYGRAFSPADTTVVREPLVSDHYAVSTHLLLPPSPTPC